MKKSILLLLLLLCQRALSQEDADSTKHTRNNITLRGMKVLGTWGIANLGGGAAGWISSTGARRHFYEMNTYWGAVNTGIAAFGWWSTRRKMGKQENNHEMISAQRTVEKTFLINSGLDMLYIGAGIYLNSHGNTRQNSRLQGYGSSVIMQGSFLLVFDGIMYGLHRSNGKRRSNFVNNTTVAFYGNKIGVIHTLP